MSSYIDEQAYAIKTLYEEGSVPSSSLSPEQTEKVEQWCDLDVLKEVKRNGGTVFLVQDDEYLEQYVRIQYPNGFKADLSGRGEAVHRTGNSKSYSGRVLPYEVRIRSRGGVHLTNGDQSLDVDRLTSLVGDITVSVETLTSFSCPQNHIGLIENAELYRHCWSDSPYTFPDFVMVYPGQLKETLLNWLTDFNRVDFYADYDPVGLRNYYRMNKELMNVEFFIPDDLDSLFERAQNNIMTRVSNQKEFHSLRKQIDQNDPVQEIIDCINRHGAALEQEILLK